MAVHALLDHGGDGVGGAGSYGEAGAGGGGRGDLALEGAAGFALVVALDVDVAAGFLH